MRVFALLAVSNLILLVAAQKIKDEDRPYKFGFNIEGHQHRKEEKDEKGIIRGEYGFITADGYYRVTVYETDEQGLFKIVSQKNYYVGFPPGDPTTTQIPVPKPIVTPAPQRPAIQPDTTSQKPPIGRGGESCGSCLLPTKPPYTARPRELPKMTTKPPYTTTATPIETSKIMAQTETTVTSFRDKILVKSLSPANKQVAVLSPLKGAPRNGDTRMTPQPQNERDSRLRTSTATTIQPRTTTSSKIPISVTPLPPAKNDDRLNAPLILTPPTRNSQLNNQENELLYRFNYTVGFHGHHEDGYRNGDKSGDYFVNGRDGVSRRVDYIANEFGYQPNITITQLKDNDPNQPKEETEKSFGLKGYEFKWFYRK